MAPANDASLLRHPPPPATQLLKTFNGRKRQFGHAPTTPTPLLARATATPVTAVPWLSPVPTGLGLLLLPIKFHPFTSSMNPLPSSSMPLFGISPGLVKRLAAKSSCVRSKPLSTIPITTFELPVVRSQARVVSASASTVPPFWPVLR